MSRATPGRFLLVVIALTSLYGLPTVGSAEPFVSLYGGAAFPQNSTVQTTAQQIDSPCFLFCWGRTFSDSRRVTYDTSFTVGGRMGYWFDPAPWFGAAFDVSYFPARASAVNIDVIPISMLLMLRAPLFASEAYPKGRIRPYAGVGPSFVFAIASTDFGPTVPPVERELSKTVGLDVRAGFDWMFAPKLALFAEYRFFNVSVETGKCESVCFPPFDSITTRLHTHTLSAGLAYHF